jgi:hypothetical protein
MKTINQLNTAVIVSFFLCCGHAHAGANDKDENSVANTKARQDQRKVLSVNNTQNREHVHLISDDELGSIRGKYLAGLTIVGLQLELLSQWQAAGNTLTAGGVLQVVHVGDGYQIQMGSHASSEAGDAWSSSAGASASGANSLQISGIGQVSQLAGDNNQHSNLTVIDFAPQDMSAQLNGQASSQATSDSANVSVDFSNGGATLAIQSSQSRLTQHVAINSGPDAAGIMQVGSLVGDDQNSSNLLSLHIMTAPTDVQVAVQNNVLQALHLMPLPKP